MDPKASSSSYDPYSGLPSQVLAISERIGFKHFSSNNQDRTEKLIQSKVPAFEKQGLRYKYYFLDDVFPPFKKKVKPIRKKDRLNAQERKKLFTISKESQLKHATFEKINQIWIQYMNIITKGNPKDLEFRLSKADYHGAKFAVLASTNPTHVGTVGFVVQETKNTFRLIDKTNRIVTVPKDGTIFSFAINKTIFKLNGGQLKLSSHQRTKTKFKSKKSGQAI